jgi:hypothetical protein
MCVKTIQIDYEGNCEGRMILSNVPDTDEFHGNFFPPSTNLLTFWGTVLFLLQQNIIIGN